MSNRYTLISKKLPTHRSGQQVSLGEPHVLVDLGGGQKLEFIWIEALGSWVGKYPTTNGQFRRFCGCHHGGYGLNGNRQPAVLVSYNDALAFCRWATKRACGCQIRLPRGDEWMTFAQCGDGRKYPWGNEWPPAYGNYADETAARAFPDWRIISGYTDGHPVTCDVEQSGENPWKLFGVGGNVWEWTSEPGEETGFVRGASCLSSLEYDLRCEFRYDYDPSYAFYNAGFRCMLFPKTP